MRLSHLCGAAAMAAILIAPAGAQAQTSFDGNWSVLVETEKGDCDRAYRYPVIIERGAIRYGGQSGFDVTGRVANNGAISARISRGDGGANVTGRLAGSSGTGTWSAANANGSCSGRWQAEKRG